MIGFWAFWWNLMIKFLLTFFRGDIKNYNGVADSNHGWRNDEVIVNNENHDENHSLEKFRWSAEWSFNYRPIRQWSLTNYFIFPASMTPAVLFTLNLDQMICKEKNKSSSNNGHCGHAYGLDRDSTCWSFSDPSDFFIRHPLFTYNEARNLPPLVDHKRKQKFSTGSKISTENFALWLTVALLVRYLKMFWSCSSQLSRKHQIRFKTSLRLNKPRSFNQKKCLKPNSDDDRKIGSRTLNKIIS